MFCLLGAFVCPYQWHYGFCLGLCSGCAVARGIIGTNLAHLKGHVVRLQLPGWLYKYLRAGSLVLCTQSCLETFRIEQVEIIWYWMCFEKQLLNEHRKGFWWMNARVLLIHSFALFKLFMWELLFIGCFRLGLASKCNTTQELGHTLFRLLPTMAKNPAKEAIQKPTNSKTHPKVAIAAIVCFSWRHVLVAPAD